MTTTAPSSMPSRRVAAHPAATRARPSIVRDVVTMSRREARRTVRSVDGLIATMVLPVVVMLVFVVIFGGAIDPTGDYIDYVLPGVLVMCLGMGSATTAVAVAQDMTSGTLDRFKTLPILGSSVLWGHVLASVVRNLASAVLVVAVALAIGLRPGAGIAGWSGFAAYAVLAVLTFTWLSAMLGLVLSVDAANSVNLIFLFVPYLSSGFVPVETMPGWLHGFANHQPFTPIIEAARGLLAGAPDGATIGAALTWLSAVLVASVVAGSILLRRRTAR